MATEDPMAYPAPQFIGGLEMPERDEEGERLATMLRHAATSAEGQTEVTVLQRVAQPVGACKIAGMPFASRQN